MRPAPTHNHPTTKPARKSGWSDERRARHAAAIRKWKPWERSTGPRTAEGKTKVAHNALKHGRRSAAARMLWEALSAQKQFLRLGMILRGVPAQNTTNKLLAALRTRLHTLNHIFLIRLQQSIILDREAKIMQKT